MATAETDSISYKLDQVGTLKLDDPDRHPGYTSIAVLSEDLLMVVDGESYNLEVYDLHDGKLLAVSDKMESAPWDVCVVRGLEVAVTLRGGQIVNLLVKCTGQSVTITRLKSININVGGTLDRCHGVRALRSTDKLVVSGVTFDKWICWGIVSLIDGHVCTIHKICEYGGLGSSYLATNVNDSNVYISCRASSCPTDNGVYAFDVITGTKRFVYRHCDLIYPRGISVDKRGFVYVCNNWQLPRIYQLTETGESVAIHREGMPPGPWAIYWEEQLRYLYVTSFGSNEVWRFHPVWSDQEDLIIPVEILHMDKKSLQMYKEILQDGKVKVYNIRVMVVGNYGVGKTTLIKRLLGKKVDISERKSTEGINVYQHSCKVILDTGEWIEQHEDSDELYRLHHLMKLLSDRAERRANVSGELEEQEVIDQKETNSENLFNRIESSDEGSDCMLTKLDSDEKGKRKCQDELSEILQLINKNADKLKSIVEYVALAMWDFSGQYVFFTTHQAFLSSRAIYLLVTDLSQQVTDLVEDECFLDIEGLTLQKVHELLEIWLNSIHSVGTQMISPAGDTSDPSPKVAIQATPPVILVGTHVDQIQEDKRQEVINMYFPNICRILRDRPALQNLEGFVAIDNTQLDSNLETLKTRIVQLASQQPHWGEENPAVWLIMETKLMKLKAEGIKVIPLSLVEELNRAAPVPIRTAEQLDLFLRFQHEVGTILYFSVDVLRENIVLDPQWFISALKSLITAEMFIFRQSPSVIGKWMEFKDSGKLTAELIDAIWTKENNYEFHCHKQHILLLMEQLNIVSRPRLLSENGEDIKMENYFLAPFMLRQKTPQEIISPEPHCQMESSSVLCYVFTEKFLPSPIFHRLLAACVAHWPIAVKKNERLIFCGCCVFQLDQTHKLTLYLREYVIFMRVTRMGIRCKTPSPKVCIEVREFINAMLVKIIGYMGQNLKFEQFIQCPESNGENVNSLIPVSVLKENAEVCCDFHDNIIESNNLLKFWFEDENTDDVRYAWRQTLHDIDRNDKEYLDRKAKSELNFPVSQTCEGEHGFLIPPLAQSRPLQHEINAPFPPLQSRDCHVRNVEQMFHMQPTTEKMMGKSITRQKENHAYLQRLQKRKDTIIYEAVHDRTGTNRMEMTIEKGDILEVLGSSGSWYHLRNYMGEVGYAPCTSLKAFEANHDVIADS